MDSHSYQTLAAREAAADDPPRRYFGYSTILDREAFEQWRDGHGFEFFDLPPGERAEALDVALVFDCPSRYWQGRVAGLEQRPGSTVQGVLYTIAGADWPIIRHKEGALTGMCVEQPVRVRLADGSEVEATAFATAPARRGQLGPVSAPFVEALTRGARSAGLSDEWIARLHELAK